jgi:hypothetical protein
MTIVNPEPDNTTKVEPKVKWATVGTYLLGVVALAIFNGVTDSTLLVDALPDWVEPFVLPIVPAIGAAIAGYSAKHQWRTSELKRPS